MPPRFLSPLARGLEASTGSPAGIAQVLQTCGDRSTTHAQAFPILNTLVPQAGQIPCVAGLRFLSVTRFGFFISTFFLHFMQ